MFLGYQEGKIKFYTEQPLNMEVYNLDKTIETQEVYVYEGDEYVLKDKSWQERERKREIQRISGLSLTKREVFLAVYKTKGLTPDDIRSQIQNPMALIEFDYATEYYRGNPLIDTIGAMFGFSSDDLDYLFEHKEFKAI